MMHGGPTMMIELIMVTEQPRRLRPARRATRRALADLGARPHWGQYNILTPARVKDLYPLWGKWLEAEKELNASGVFDSEFTRRIGA